MDDHQTTDSIPALIRSVLDDARELIREEIAVARAEVREEISTAKAAARPLPWAIAIFTSRISTLQASTRATTPIFFPSATRFPAGKSCKIFI